MAEHAVAAFRALSGVFCIYKPAGRSMKQVVAAIKTNLIKDLNTLPCRPVRPRVVFEESSSSPDLPTPTTVPDLADHPLVVGPRYIEDDLTVRYVSRLEHDASGVVVMGIGASRGLLTAIAAAQYVRVYRMEGQLGTATQDFKNTGRIVEKTTYHHVTHGKIDKVIAAMQAGHQRYMYQAAEVDLQSQEAYEMAKTGLIRPKNREAGPVIYGMRCIDFNPPDFSLEVHAINEHSDYLAELVHEMGLELKASAVSKLVRRIRYGHFTLTHALLRKHWTLQSILENIDFCRPLVAQEKLLRQRQLVEQQFPAGVIASTNYLPPDFLTSHS